MEQKLHFYVGRIVRLKKALFEEVRNQAIRKELSLENSFLVTEVSRKMRKLICYGASFRFVVDVSDVVLV